MRNCSQPSLAIRSEGETRSNIFHGQIREIIQEFLYRHPASQIIKHIRHSDARAFYTGLSASNSWINTDAIFVIHVCSLSRPS